MAFPLDKILSIGPRDFDEFIKPLRNYEIVGVNISVYVYSDDGLEEFAKKIPEGTERVIDFGHSSTGPNSKGAVYYTAKGLALIPKKNDKRK